jgi:hypothetical protein
MEPTTNTDTNQPPVRAFLVPKTDGKPKPKRKYIKKKDKLKGVVIEHKEIVLRFD